MELLNLLQSSFTLAMKGSSEVPSEQLNQDINLARVCVN